jgi:hypothetical protein
MRSLSWPAYAVLIPGSVILLAWPALFPELFASVDFLVPMSHAAVLLCFILMILSVWRRLGQMLSRPMRIASIVGFGALVIWSWTDSVVESVEVPSFSRSKGDLFISTSYLAACFCCVLVILRVGCRVGLPLKRQIPRIRKATALFLLALAIQVLGTGTILAVHRPTSYGPFYIDDILPRFGAWFFGDTEKRPAAMYRFEFNQLQITYLFDTPDSQKDREGWYLFFAAHAGGWPIKVMRDSTTKPGSLPLDSIVLLSCEDLPLHVWEGVNGRFIQIAAHFTIPGILLFIYPLLVLKQRIRQHRRDQRRRKGLCASCGYDLTANVSGRCPECGTPVNSTIPDSPPAEPTSPDPSA